MLATILSLSTLTILKDVLAFSWTDIQLPSSHIPVFLNSNPDLKQICAKDTKCPFKAHLQDDLCWGYEEECSKQMSYSQSSCPGHHRGWVNSKEEQFSTFFTQGDFGYVKQRREELQPYCQGEDGESILQCSDHLEFCKGQNLLIDFRDLMTRREPVRYHMDVLEQGKIGGKCRLKKQLLEVNSDYLSPLQSWAPELRFFSEFNETIEKESPLCDIWVSKPAIVTKIDASVSMYHHFCDFLNLYASQHVNSSDAHAFMTNTQVLIWETYPYSSNFGVAWTAFTQNPIWNLENVAGKRVCFANVMFPLLPRTIFGLYYNTPLIWGCEKSGLFHAFSHHMLHRLGVPERKEVDEKIHVSFLSRQTKHRRVLNEDQLISALQSHPAFVVQKVKFTHGESFLDQLRQDQWTDILIGLHGAGLTHALFLPDWAVLIELYDCGDPNCYQDLARLRGVKYLSWTDKSKMFPEDQGHHPDLGAHEKFTNYVFDEQEFVRLVKKAASLVRQDPTWKSLSKHHRRDEL